MELKIRSLLAVAGCLILLLPFLNAATEEANVFFNAGTEKYLQGNYTEAVNNLEKAQTADPDNSRIKDFMVKILLEASTQNHLTRNYRQALAYLEKAQKIAPDNAKVQEMYKMTMELVNPTDEKTAKSETGVQQKNTEAVVKRDKLPDVIEPIKTQKQPDLVRQAEKKFQEMIERQETRKKKGFLSDAVGGIKETYIIIFLVWTLLVTMASFIFFIIAYMKYREAEGYKIRSAPLEIELNAVKEEKNTLLVELEKTKERYRYEHQAVEGLQKDAVENKKLDEKRFKAELDAKAGEIEQRIRAEMQVQYSADKGQKESFMRHQENRFMKYVSDTSAPEAEADPVLSSARERIALMAQNLYEYDPVAALDFITKMATNTNPLVRTNIVQALANISKPETFGLLFMLYDDADPRVKREVLRNLKMLNQKSATGVISLEEPVTERIRSLIAKEKDRGEWIF